MNLVILKFRGAGDYRVYSRVMQNFQASVCNQPQRFLAAVIAASAAFCDLTWIFRRCRAGTEPEP